MQQGIRTFVQILAGRNIVSKKNYPVLGYIKTTELFNSTFSNKRSAHGIQVKCKKIGLKPTPERKAAIPVENTKCLVYPVGAEVKKQHGEIYVKTENGYKRKKELVYGEVPKGMSLVHLDGDRGNCEKENLLPMSRYHLARMTKNKFWSRSPVITKTGYMCCELERIVNETD